MGGEGVGWPQWRMNPSPGGGGEAEGQIGCRLSVTDEEGGACRHSLTGSCVSPSPRFAAANLLVSSGLSAQGRGVRWEEHRVPFMAALSFLSPALMKPNEVETEPWVSGEFVG